MGGSITAAQVVQRRREGQRQRRRQRGGAAAAGHQAQGHSRATVRHCFVRELQARPREARVWPQPMRDTGAAEGGQNTRVVSNSRISRCRPWHLRRRLLQRLDCVLEGRLGHEGSWVDGAAPLGVEGHLAAAGVDGGVPQQRH